MTIRILLVDDHTILREGIKALLKYYDDVEIAGEADNGIEAIHLYRLLKPDVVLMDIAMPEMNGLEATRTIRLQNPEAKILILTQYEDQHYILPLLQAGAAGYILKRAFGTDLIKAIRSVAGGESFLYPSVTTIVLEQLRNANTASNMSENDLSTREKEILRKVASGETSRQIALFLNISVKTVEWHRGNIMKKLGLHSVAELVNYAVKKGYVD
ncbi:MAG: response regulator transcription factor [Anaerolineae bacterium]|nr:response regulator transcription factor [Anaerolineae bacterium]